MNDWLSTVANVAQIVGTVWALFLGGKTIVGFIRAIRLRHPFSISSSHLTTIFTFLILLMVIASFFGVAGNSWLPGSWSGPLALHQGGIGQSKGTVQSTISTATSISLTTAPSEVVNVGKKLTCGGCNTSFLVTVDTLAIDAADNRVVLSYTLKNMTYQPLYAVNFSNFSKTTLKCSWDTQPHNGEGDMTANIGAEGQQQQITLTFTFVPYRHTPYRLVIDYGDPTFDPITVTF